MSADTTLLVEEEIDAYMELDITGGLSHLRPFAKRCVLVETDIDDEGSATFKLTICFVNGDMEHQLDLAERATLEQLPRFDISSKFLADRGIHDAISAAAETVIAKLGHMAIEFSGEPGCERAKVTVSVTVGAYAGSAECETADLAHCFNLPESE